MTIARQIHDNFNKLTRGEKKAAQTLLTKYPAAGLETVDEFASHAGIGNATLLRFVRKLGFPVYADFQRALRVEIGESKISPLEQYDRYRGEEATENTYLSRFLFDSQSNLDATFTLLNRADLEELIYLLSDENNRLYFIGGRFTQFISSYIALHFSQIRKKVHDINGQSETWASSLVDIDRRSIVIVFDFRRYQRDVIAFSEEAAKRGARIVLFTDNWLSPIARVADSSWCCPVDIPSPYDSILSCLALCEYIIGAVIQLHDEKLKQRIEDIDILRRKVMNESSAE